MAEKQTKLKDIAEAAGVDISTVSLCLNGSPKVAVKTKERIKELALEMNYTPNITAQALRSGKSNTIGIGLFTLSSPFFARMLVPMHEYFYIEKYFTIITAIKNRDCKWILNNLLQRNIDGLCLGIPNRHFELYKNFTNSGKPLSLFLEKSKMHHLKDVEANLAVLDIFSGTPKIFQHLFELNHKRIAFIDFYLPSRYQDYCRQINENNIELDESIVINEWSVYQEFEEKIENMMKIPEPPTAIYAGTDRVAMDIIKILLNKGYRIPEDVSVIGINDSPESEILSVPLTTLKVPVMEIGKAMAEMVIDQINEPGSAPKIRYFDTELIVRESTAAV